METLNDVYLPETSIKAIIGKSRDKEALEEHMTAYHSAIPPKKPLSCHFDYFESAKACDEMGFETFVTLDLNRVACALGMGFFSLGSEATLPWGHIFFHKFNWSEEQREQYRSMSRAEHEAHATKWAFDKELAAGVSTIGVTLLYRYIDPRGRPNPLGVSGLEINVLPKARAVLYLQSQRSDIRAMQPNLLLRWALEHYPGLTAEDTLAKSARLAVQSEDVQYRRFSLDGDEAAQIATLERLERDSQCEDYAHVIKLLCFWSKIADAAIEYVPCQVDHQIAGKSDVDA